MRYNTITRELKEAVLEVWASGQFNEMEMIEKELIAYRKDGEAKVILQNISHEEGNAFIKEISELDKRIAMEPYKVLLDD